MKKRLAIILIFVLIGVGCYFGWTTVQALRAELERYKANQQFVFDDEAGPGAGVFILHEGRLYLSLEVIKERQLLDYRYSGSKKRILFAVDQSEISYENADIQHYLRNSIFEMNLPILVVEGGEYIEMESLSRFANFQYRWIADENRLVLDTQAYKIYTGRVAKNGASLKISADLHTLTAETLQAYDEVRLFKETDKAYKVRLEDGLVGYVKKEDINLIEEKTSSTRWQVKSREPFEKYFKVGMAWDAISSYEDNIAKRPTERHQGLDVLSPTWFKLTNEGWVLNDADLGYVEEAHVLGYALWPLFSNDFDPELTHGMLSDDGLRRRVVAQLIQYAAVYGFDGINLDFENVYLADQQLMTQFVRELSAEAHRMGLVFSIDVTVPWGSDQWSKFVDRKAMAPYMDYFILMAYDEYWASSPTAGSVASLPWVEKGVAETLKLVPKDKLILGYPLYMREWTETIANGKVNVDSSTLSILNADTYLREQLYQKVWDPATGQNYIEYKDGSDVKKVWLEDESSLELKLQLVRTYDLAGASGWRKGFEEPWLWPLLEKMLKN